jgi:hypothetical protein
MMNAQLREFGHYPIGQCAIPYAFKKPTAIMKRTVAMLELFAGGRHIFAFFVQTTMAGIQVNTKIFFHFFDFRWVSSPCRKRLVSKNRFSSGLLNTAKNTKVFHSPQPSTTEDE